MRHQGTCLVSVSWIFLFQCMMAVSTLRPAGLIRDMRCPVYVDGWMEGVA